MILALGLAASCNFALAQTPGATDSAAQPAAASDSAAPPLSAQAPAAAAPEPPQAAPTPARKPGFLGWLASPDAFRPELSALLILNRDPGAGVESTTFPQRSMGLGLEYSLGPSGLVTFEPGLTIHDAWYRYTAGGRAVTGIDTIFRDAWVMGFLLDFPFLYNLKLGAKSSIALGAGPAFNLRFGIKATTDTPDANVSGINAFLWDQGRFFMPSTHARYEYKVSERYRLGATLSMYWPIFNLWAGEGLGFFDQATFGLAVTLRSPLP